MHNMENAEEILQILERYTRLKQKDIPKELDDYLCYVAKTGDTVYTWANIKYFFREKLLSVIKDFHDTTPNIDDLPQYPNVDPFNYEGLKSTLLERLDLFNAAPFTIQRLCELLTDPRKQYSRIDKFMRALEKNILVVSTIEPGRKHAESENGDSLDSVVNGDLSLDVNVDIDIDNDSIFTAEAQNATSSANNTHKSDDDILPNPKKAKLDLPETGDSEMETEETALKADVVIEKEAAVVKDAKEDVDAAAIPLVEEPSAEATPAAKNEENGSSEKSDELGNGDVQNDVVIEAAEKKVEDTNDKVDSSVVSTTEPVEKMEDDAETKVQESKVDETTVDAVAEKTTDEKSVEQPIAAVEELKAAEPIEETKAEEETSVVVSETKSKADEKLEPEIVAQEEEVKPTEISIEKTDENKVEDKGDEKKEQIEEKVEEKQQDELKSDDKENIPAAEIGAKTDPIADEIVLEQKTSDNEIVPAAAVVEEPAVVPVAEETVTSTEQAVVETVPEETKENETPKLVEADEPEKEAPTELKETEPEPIKATEEMTVEEPVAVDEVSAPEVKIPENDKVSDVSIIEEPIGDQPMDENIEAPPVAVVVAEPVATATVATSNDENEMAVEPAEAVKDDKAEPAKMDVDDTSQEAMDQ